MNAIIRVLFIKDYKIQNENIIKRISDYIFINMINDMLFSLKKTNSKKLLGFGNKSYLNKLIYTPNSNSNINKNLQKILFNKNIAKYYNFIDNKKLINKYNNLNEEQKNKINDLIIYSIKLNIHPEEKLLKYKLNKIISENYSTMEDIN